jgi:AraC-like DNA-binding protein
MQQMSIRLATEDHESFNFFSSKVAPLTPASITTLHPDRAPHDSLPTQLNIAITASLGKVPLDIAQAAESIGTSVRTLQRKLNYLGLNYSMLLDQARRELASQLLLESDKKIIDLAYELGYEDPSHFARAFRRMTGESPRDYRAGGFIGPVVSEKFARTG